MSVRGNKCCAVCGQNKPTSSFHQSPNPIHGRYLPFCKTCCSERYKHYFGILNDKVAALWCLLAELAIPFKKDVWESTQKLINVPSTGSGRNLDLFLAYLNTFRDFGYITDGFFESDIMLTDIIAPKDKEENKDEQEAKQPPVPVLIDLEEQIDIWGRFLDVDGNIDTDAYRFLNKSFDEYTADLLEMDANLINRYRDLARCEYRLRKANESGDIQEISKAQTSLNNQLALLKLNNFGSADKSDTRRAFEKNIAIVEYTKPAECEDLQKYLDMVGYEREKAMLMRSLRNAIAGTKEYPALPRD